MTTFADLKAKLNEARKARDSQTTLAMSTMVGNLLSNAKLIDGEKVVSDDDVTVYLKKCVKNLEETLAIKETPEARWELGLVESFLPKQLTDVELAAIWDKISATNVGEFMKHLKENYLGQYDGKVASQVAKSKG